MAEFLVLARDNRVIRCEGDGFVWGRMESRAVFEEAYPFRDYPGKLSLIKCPGMSKAEGQTLVGMIFSAEWLDAESQVELETFETTIPDWALLMSVSNGD